MIDPKNYDLVHHVLAYECNAEATFDDNKLPIGLCDDLGSLIEPCAANIALGWAVGGDEVRKIGHLRKKGSFCPILSS